jgi:glucose/arabinose dehydrogenase
MPRKRPVALVVVFVLVATVVGGGAWLRHTNYGAYWDRLTGTDSPEDGPLPAVKLERVFEAFEFDRPLYFGHAGDGTNEVYVVEQPGRIWRFENREGVNRRVPWFDIRERIPGRRHNEEGLLALEFHPGFKDNGYFYVHYSQHAGEGKPRRGVTSRFKVTGERRMPDMDSELIIHEIEQPAGNHNGCALKFGPDGYLYVSIGDGGNQHDPDDHGQNLATQLGTVLRIDVNKQEDGRNYAIPEDNPFVDHENAAPEIWAYGLRNIWRMSIDPETGLLWGADVGQWAREEVNIITRGGNYGWARREGFIAHQGGEKTDDMINPIVDYGRRDGISITGGYVYRGERFPDLRGAYIYADYGTGRVWGLRYDHEEGKLLTNQLLGHFPRATISSFGLDADGELYACAHRPGHIYQVVTD